MEYKKYGVYLTYLTFLRDLQIHFVSFPDLYHCDYWKQRYGSLEYDN